MDMEKILQDFPLLRNTFQDGRRIAYLDSGATSQKPQCVIDAEKQYYETLNANVHRGIYHLSEAATEATEVTREKVRSLIHAGSASEIIYTRNATESMNLITRAWGESSLKKDDLVVLTVMEHHANIVPWQMLSEKIGIRLEFIPLTEEGNLDQEAYGKLLEMGPKAVSVSGMSNVLGTIPPIKEMARKAHAAGAIFIMDGAQAVPHMKVDVQDLDVDLLAFSAHKMLGPTGLGILYGKKSLLEKIPPFLGGGDMIAKVHLRSFSCNDLPYKFEAGTPAIAEEISFAAAIDYLTALGMDQIFAHEQILTHLALERVKEVPGLRVYGPQSGLRGGAVSFTLDYVHPHDVADILSHEGVCVRAGHHCAMPLHEYYKIPATTRASFYLYNTEEDIDRLIEALMKVYKLFG